MKKLFILSICLCLFKIGFSANDLRAALINANSKDAAQSIFEGYSNHQKASVWVDKLNQVLSLTCWNENQIALLTSFRNEIVAGIFVAGSQTQQDFQTWSESWKTRALQYFSISQVRFILTLVSDYKASYTSGGSSSGSSCNCSTGDDFCDGIIISTGDACKSGGCETKSSGCGKLWMYTCNGTCQGVQPSGINTIIW
ncbi:MAG: hypothetical protein CFE21_16830 [Bacteroidetes bacterium B1(2017)]|nr:MAG: hypothetical protein CFE21_16830 [Bacteroidetes bacterium B1(2017)]